MMCSCEGCINDAIAMIKDTEYSSPMSEPFDIYYGLCREHLEEYRVSQKGPLLY